MSCFIVRNEDDVVLSKDTRRTKRANVHEQGSRLPNDTFHAFHFKKETEKICETFMTLRGILCSENVMERWKGPQQGV